MLLCLEVLDFFGGGFAKNFSKDSRLTIMLITMGISLICEIISCVLHVALFKLSFGLLTIVKIIIIEALFNVIIVIIIYPLLEKSGEILMKTFKEKNIFTKYY